MNRLVYLAAPIDRRHHGTEEQQKRLAVWRLDAIGKAGELGLPLYDPTSAFLVTPGCSPDASIVKVNWMAVARSAGMIALLPGTPTVGVPMEIERARNIGIPCAVVCVEPTWALQFTSDYLEVFDDPVAALEWLEGKMRDDAEAQGARWRRFTLQWSGAGKPPTKHHEGDAGYDLHYHGTAPIEINPSMYAEVPSGIAIAPPEGMWLFLCGRSSSFKNRGLLVHPSVIDAGFRGELFAMVRNVGHRTARIEPGERVAQLVPMSLMGGFSGLHVRQVEVLPPGDRGDAGFGSTGV